MIRGLPTLHSVIERHFSKWVLLLFPLLSAAFVSDHNVAPVLHSLAGEDILRIEAVTKLTVGHVFTHLAFLKDLEFKRKQATA